MKIDSLIRQIGEIDKSLKANANKAVNQLLTLRNWLIGFYIVEYEQNGEDRAKYGERLLETIAKKLNRKGLSYRNLKLFRKFYLIFPEIGQTLSALINGSDVNFQSLGNNGAIGQTVSALLKNNADLEQKNISDFADEKTKLAVNVLTRLSFSHIVLLLSVDDELKRSFYAIEAIKGVWSVRELKRQINSLLFERSGLSKKQDLLMKQIQESVIPENRDMLVKDVYTFEFLDLPVANAVEESDLESALIEHLRDFILELGNGFCLEARQKRVLIGDEYFFIDLVFYHRILKCHILIDLKVEEFNHTNVSQLNAYLNYYKKEIMQPDDNEPIGILMVTNKNDALVEFALAGLDENIFVSKYLLQIPGKKKLQEFLLKEIKKL